MSVEVIPWLRASPQRTAFADFCFYRQKFIESIARLPEADLELSDSEKEITGTLDAIRTQAESLGLIRGADNPPPAPCRETLGSIWNARMENWLVRLHDAINSERPHA